MVKLILNKKYKTNIPGDLIEANKKLEERLVNKGMAYYAPKEAIEAELIFDGIEIKPKVKVIKKRKPRKKKTKKFEW